MSEISRKVGKSNRLMESKDVELAVRMEEASLVKESVSDCLICGRVVKFWVSSGRYFLCRRIWFSIFLVSCRVSR